MQKQNGGAMAARTTGARCVRAGGEWAPGTPVPWHHVLDRMHAPLARTPFEIAVCNLLLADPDGVHAPGEPAIFLAECRALRLHPLERWEHTVRGELDRVRFRQHPAAGPGWTPPRGLTAWLELCSGDGYRREAALWAIDGAAPAALLVALALRRLNDWVPQVRRAAREAVGRIARRSDPELVAEALWAVLPHWTSWGRLEDADREAVFALVADELVARAVQRRLMRATTGPATQVLAQLARVPRGDAGLRALARDAVQPAVRALATRWLLDGRAAWTVGRRWVWTAVAWNEGRYEAIVETRDLSVQEPFLAVLDDALRDRSPMVRRVAAEILIRERDRLGDQALPRARQLAADPSPSVAERGCFALKLLEGPP